MARLLEIFVSPHCLGCATAVRLAARVEALSALDVDVRIIDLSAPGSVRPPAVFAVPTYLLNGTVISLGNPEENWLMDRLAPGPAAHGEQQA